MMGEVYAAQIRRHYEARWGTTARVLHWDSGPAEDLPDDFTVLEFPPSRREFWTYATCAMSQPADERRVELHLFSPEQTMLHVELLTAIAHYHRTAAKLDLNHTVNFGRPWLAASRCDHGLISLPYLDGPPLEQFTSSAGHVRCLWLVPITRSELDFAKRRGVAALEDRFEAASFNYLDPRRSAVA